MNTNKDFSPSFLIFCAELGYLFKIANNYKTDAITLKENTSTCTSSFHLLSSLALEIFPKLLIGYDVCLKYKDKTKNDISDKQIREEIATNMSKFNHNLKALYENFPDLITALNIEDITGFKNNYMWEYRMKLKGSDYLISLKDIEAVRYGSFAKNMDIMTDCTGDHIIINLLNKLFTYIRSKEHETKEQLKIAYSKF